jgi:transposase-like protein
MRSCVKCGSSERQVKKGFTGSGSQRYQCQGCGATYTPEPKEQGYSQTTRRQAVQLYSEGLSLRAIAGFLKVDPQSVSNWIKAYVAQLPPAPLPASLDTVEMDELYSFVQKKKPCLPDHTGGSAH